jgi:hypothetical protein
MSTFQIVFAPLLMVLAIVTGVAAARRRLVPRVALAWVVLWVSSAAVILRPEITVAVAHFLGIARGADLVFYLGVLAMFLGFFVVYMRLRRIEAQITTLVRALALMEAGITNKLEGD